MSPIGCTGAAAPPKLSQRELEMAAGRKLVERYAAAGTREKPGGPGPGTPFSGDTGIASAVTTKQTHDEATGTAGPGIRAACIDLTKSFLERVLPWPAPTDPGYVNLHWLIPAPNDQSKRIWVGKPTKTLAEFNDLLAWVLTLPDATDIYMCMSQQAKCAPNKKKTGFKALRSREGALLLKAIFLDVDVKPPPKGYATLGEAIDAVAEFRKAHNLPPPSALVHSGGGLHVYWAFTRAVTVTKWQPLADGLKALALGVPQRSRRAGTYRRICRLMVELLWTPVRVRGLTRGGYMEQVRGYARDARHRSTPPAQDRARVIYGAPALVSPDIADLLLSPSPIDPPATHIAATQPERNTP